MSRHTGKDRKIQNILGKFKLPSLWWKNLCAVGKEFKIPQNWLMAYAKKSIGDGESTFFDMIFGWEESSLAYTFPRLFSLSTEKNNKVSQMKS